MDEQAFRQLLQERNLSDEQIEQHIAIAARFEDFAGASSPPTAEDVTAFTSLLIQEGLNSYDNLLALARYGHFIHNDPVFVAALELVDGAEALQGLYDKLGEAAGEGKRDQVFQGIELPPLGTPNAEKPRVTQAVLERMERLVDAETCKKVLSSGLRRLEDKWFLDGRKKYLECGSVDAYLEIKGEEFIAELEKCQREGRLFFSQEITDEVLDFVRAHPEITYGYREGRVVYEVKIPYMTKEYLAETDERMKRYYYCHCPWVRESLKTGDVSVSPAFCLCSAGFHKKPWEVIFDQPLEAEVIESVLQGDPWCKLAIHLPPEAVLFVP